MLCGSVLSHLLLLCPLMVGDAALSVVCSYKCLGVMFDSQLNWSHHVGKWVCKSMSYYLALIGSHAKNLPSIIKMLVECLVFSRYSYALPVWGPAIHRDSLSRLSCLHNRGIRLTCGLRKYDHMSQHRTRLGWLPVNSFVKYHSLITLFRDHYIGGSVSLNPAFQFGRTHSYGTRCRSCTSYYYISFHLVKKIFGIKHLHGGILFLKAYFRTSTCSMQGRIQGGSLGSRDPLQKFIREAKRMMY